MVELDLETDHTSGPQTQARRLYWRSLSAGQGHQSLGFTTVRTLYITQIVSRQPGDEMDSPLSLYTSGKRPGAPSIGISLCDLLTGRQRWDFAGFFGRCVLMSKT